MLPVPQPLNLDNILAKAYAENTLTDEELRYLLGLEQPDELSLLFKTARQLRSRYFNNKIFLYGFVYFSTYCRNNCNFCLYRCSNQGLSRYRKTEKEILDTANGLMESGVHLLDLTMGEDPVYIENGFYKLFEMVEKVKKETNAPLMISPGLIPKKVIKELRNMGIDWYACYQETHTRELYEKLRIGQSYDLRLEMKFEARDLGLLIEEGLLTGVGDTNEDVIHSFKMMQKLQADQIRVMSFVPQQGTPMQKWRQVSRLRELIIIAVMRLVFPDRLIPASLDVDGLSGLTARLDAGANVITSIIPPMSGLAGVSQSTLDIEEGNRSVQGLLPVLAKTGLVIASRQEYIEWMVRRKEASLK